MEALKKGTPNDPAAKAERLTKPPGTTKEAFNEYVTNEIEDYFLEANRIWNEEYERMERTQTDPVPDYLPAGKRIDWTYPD